MLIQEGRPFKRTVKCTCVFLMGKAAKIYNSFMPVKRENLSCNSFGKVNLGELFSFKQTKCCWLLHLLITLKAAEFYLVMLRRMLHLGNIVIYILCIFPSITPHSKLGTYGLSFLTSHRWTCVCHLSEQHGQGLDTDGVECTLKGGRRNWKFFFWGLGNLLVFIKQSADLRQMTQRYREVFETWLIDYAMCLNRITYLLMQKSKGGQCTQQLSWSRSKNNNIWITGKLSWC